MHAVSAALSERFHSHGPDTPEVLRPVFVFRRRHGDRIERLQEKFCKAAASMSASFLAQGPVPACARRAQQTRSHSRGAGRVCVQAVADQVRKIRGLTLRTKWRIFSSCILPFVLI